MNYSNDAFVDIPNQMVSLKEKQKYDWKHVKDTADGYIRMSSFNTSEKEDLEKWYRIYNGEKINEHYLAVEDPFGTLSTSNPMPLNKVKAWNVLRANTDIIINDKEKRPWNFIAVVKNPEAQNEMLMKRDQEIMKFLKRDFVNIANKSGQDTGVPTQNVPNLESFAGKFESDYRDKRAIEAQKIADVAIQEEKIREKLNREGMKHWVIAGEVCTYKGIRFNDFVYEIINPLNIDFIKGPSIKYGRDAEAVVYWDYLAVSEIVDRFRDILTEDELIRLDSGTGSKTAEPIDYNKMQFIRDNDLDLHSAGNLREVVHVPYRTYKKIFYVFYTDEMGEDQIEEFDESFDKTLFPYQIDNIEEEWRTCIYEVYRIDGDIYAGMGEIPYTSRKLDNPSIAPLPYNQVKFSDLNAKNTSIIAENYIYQFYWNVYKAKQEHLVNKDKGEVALIDLAMLAEWGLGAQDFDKSMYYMETMNIAFVDSRRDDFGKFQQSGAKINLSQANSINAITSVLIGLKQELDLNMGITQQRRGNVSASAGKSATEQAIEMSYTVSEGIFVDFENFEEIELNDILNTAKIAYAESKKGQFFIEGMPMYLDLEGMNIEEEELGIVMSKASKDKRSLDAMKQLIQPFAQNVGKGGVTPDLIAEMADSNNIPKIKQAMGKADAAIKEYEQAIRDHEQQIKEKELAAMAQEADKQRDNDDMNKELDRQKDITVAKIRAAGFEEETVIGDIDTGAIDKSAADIRKNQVDQEKLSLERTKHKDEMKEAEKERTLKLKLKEMDLQNPTGAEAKNKRLSK